MFRLSMTAVAKVKCRFAEPVPQKLLAEIVASKSPEYVGAPEIQPVMGFRVNPTGRFCALNDVGAPEAVIRYVKAVA